MAMNQSLESRQRGVRASPLDAWTGEQLDIRCRCGRQVSYWCHAVASACPGLSVGEAVARLRCRECGEPPARVAISGTLSGRRVWMALVGA